MSSIDQAREGCMIQIQLVPVAENKESSMNNQQTASCPNVKTCQICSKEILPDRPEKAKTCSKACTELRNQRKREEFRQSLGTLTSGSTRPTVPPTPPTTATSAVYYGSDGAATRRYLRVLEQSVGHGRIAAQLFRAQKASARAKVYRTPRGSTVSYRAAAYRRKEESLAILCLCLAGSNMTWGWGEDRDNAVAPWVLYVELPGVGQVSFHAPHRGSGPDFAGKWDGAAGRSESRVVAFCEAVLSERVVWPTAEPSK